MIFAANERKSIVENGNLTVFGVSLAYYNSIKYY